MRLLSAFLFATLFTMSCATPQVPVTTNGITPGDVSAPEIWGGATNVTTLKYLSFSEQPDLATLQMAKAKGVTTILSLRDPSENDWDERSAVEELGMKFVNIPVSKGSDTLDGAAMTAIGDVVKAQKGQRILLHCSSGNRAAAWLATHLVNDHKMSEEAALAIARNAGLTKKGMEERVRNYLKGNHSGSEW